MGVCSPSGVRAHWGVSWASASHGRRYKWQRSVLSEPRRDWPGVVPKFRATRSTFRLKVLGNLPFNLSVPSSSFILRTGFACHLWQPVPSHPPHQKELGNPFSMLLCHQALVPLTCCCLCCPSPRRAASRCHLGLHSSL